MPSRNGRRGRRHIRLLLLTMLLLIGVMWLTGSGAPLQAAPSDIGNSPDMTKMVTPADRQNAADARRLALQDSGGMGLQGATANPGGTPDYFGTIPNYANSPLPSGPVASISLMAGGSGYTGSTHVTISDAYGTSGASGATAHATIASGVITGIVIDTGGNGYIAPVVSITDAVPGGSGALANAAIGGAVTGGIRKFVDALPLFNQPNDLGQYLQVAVNDTAALPAGVTWQGPAADYYWIGLIQFSVKMHKDLPATTIRGYVQLDTGATSGGASTVAGSLRVALTYPNGLPILYKGLQVYAVASPQYLGPTVVAQSGKPVRVKFTNFLPKTAGGDLFLPVDSTLMGAGMGPNGGSYSSNRATLHLHGGVTPWISDGTMHQWTTPYGTSEAYPKGVSVRDVPDMLPANTSSGTGDLTFYYTNQQSARLMFYHDHAYGITRLNVYAGEAAAYLVRDSQEASLISSGAVPPFTAEVPLVIQDKTFVDANTIAAQDPTWNAGTTPGTAHTGDLWFPHVYMPNQNPTNNFGANAMGRWDYGPWFWPPFTGLTHGPVTNPLAGTTPDEGPVNPGTPTPSIVPEGFMDTPIVNGTAYPYLTVQPKAYRFRILNACNDRYLNLQLYFAASNGQMWNASGVLLDANAGEVPMVPAVAGLAGTAGYPADILDGRTGGVPDTTKAGPSMIQIGTEGGFLPNPAVLPNTPIGYTYNRRDITVLNVSTKTLFLGPAERADVIIDFTGIPAGTKLILYNDAPAPVPAFDPRNDYYTGDPDNTSTGGAPTTIAGYGPDTRTIMQIQVSGSATAPANLTLLQTALPAAYAASQPAPVIGQAAYNLAFGANYPADPYVRIQDTTVGLTADRVSSLFTRISGGAYTSVPTVTLSAPSSPTGTRATATAVLATTSVASLALTNGGSGYTTIPGLTFTGGGGSGAAGTVTLSPTGSIKSITLTSGGSGYRSTPTISFTGGGSGAVATATIGGGGFSGTKVTSVRLVSGGSNYLPTATVVFTGGSPTTAATASAAVGRSVASVALDGGGSGYTSVPAVGFSGGGGSGALATATLAPAPVASLTLTNAGSGYTAAPTVSFSGGGGTGANFTASLAAGQLIALRPKAIQELFSPDYGQMNAILGVEVPNTTGINQTTIPYYMVDPPTEVINTAAGPTPAGTLMQSLPDGTQIWKITHNGVDTHAIHWHMYNVQVINRVGWDGMVKPPDANELGWKDTVRMNPLEDVIVAIKPIVPTLPWQIPNSIRPLDVTMPLGTSMPNEFTNVDPTGQPATVLNSLVNFGWEYVWHCHLLGHEENDMMRSVAFGVAPVAPTVLSATGTSGGFTGTRVVVTFRDNSINETGFSVQRATSLAGPWTTVGTINRAAPTQNANGSINDAGLSVGGTLTFTDTVPVRGATNYYRVIANDVIGYTQTYAAPAVGYPTETVQSLPSAPSAGVAL